MAPGEELARELEKDIIRRHAEFDAWWGEQWRKNEAMERRISGVDEAVGERFNGVEGRVRTIEDWKNNVTGRFAIVSFFGSLLGGAIVTGLVKLLTGHQ